MFRSMSIPSARYKGRQSGHSFVPPSIKRIVSHRAERENERRSESEESYVDLIFHCFNQSLTDNKNATGKMGKYLTAPVSLKAGSRHNAAVRASRSRVRSPKAFLRGARRCSVSRTFHSFLSFLHGHQLTPRASSRPRRSRSVARRSARRRARSAPPLRTSTTTRTPSTSTTPRISPSRTLTRPSSRTETSSPTGSRSARRSKLPAQQVVKSEVILTST